MWDVGFPDSRAPDSRAWGLGQFGQLRVFLNHPKNYILKGFSNENSIRNPRNVFSCRVQVGSRVQEFRGVELDVRSEEMQCDACVSYTLPVLETVKTGRNMQSSSSCGNTTPIATCFTCCGTCLHLKPLNPKAKGGCKM